MNITLENVLAKLPMAAIMETIHRHAKPMTDRLPDKRLGRVVEQAIAGILAGQTPVVTGIARHNSKTDGETWSVAKRLYRFLNNPRIETAALYAGLYEVGQQEVARENPDYLVVAVDPVNFEKPYAQAIEGVSVVHKATPPDLSGEARLAHGYPAITATVVNTTVPAISYAKWFSYQTKDFVSQNKEIEQALVSTYQHYPDRKIRFVGDSEMDDQKKFEQVGRLNQEFVFRAKHMDRIVEVYNPRLDRWEREKLQDLTDTVLHQATFQVAFSHAGRTYLNTIAFGWFRIRLPGKTQDLWGLVADDLTLNRQLVLLTNVPLEMVPIVKQVYEDWRLRSRIEHGYRFDQEQGLDVEDMRVRTLERMRRLFALVLLAAQVVCVIAAYWPPKAVRWLRQLGGKLDLATDRDGPYWLLQGLAAVIITSMTLSFAFLRPFPVQEMSCG